MSLAAGIDAAEFRDRGGARVRAASMRISVAAIAGWTCNRGYRRTSGSCEPVAVPPNAYLSAAGDDWECDEHYRKVEASCTADAPR